MREYIEKLRDELNSVLERPVTLGRAEEAAKYAEAIQALEAMHGHYKGCDRLSVDDAIKWTQHMENADGTTGPHWTMEQTTAVAESMGIQAPVVQRWAWGVTMNMMYSDYYHVAMEFGVNRPEFYAALAKAFLMDKDGPEPEEKLCAYYKYIVMRWNRG